MKWLGYQLPIVFVNDVSGAIGLHDFDGQIMPVHYFGDSTKTTHGFGRIRFDP